MVGATTAITRRTTLRKAFLAPWHPLVDQVRLYSLAWAQSQCGVEVHSSVAVVNHHHTSVTATAPNLPDFTRLFHGDMSKALNTLLANERYDSPRDLFDDRPTHYMRLVDAEAQLSHQLYEVLNPVAAGLVARPEHMPMTRVDYRLWKRRYLDVPRPPLFFDPRARPDALQLRVTPEPLLLLAFDGDLDALVHHLSRLEEEGIRQLRSTRRRAPMGAKLLQRIHPWDEPRTLREPGGGRRPTFKVGARNMTGRQTGVRCAAETTRFRGEHRESRVANRDGEEEVAYPFGTYGARVHQGARVAPEPHPDALLLLPGPTLADAKAELAGRRADGERASMQRRNDMLDEMRDVLADEASELVDHEDLELARKVVSAPAPTPSEPTEPPDEGDGRAGVEVRHRLDAKPGRRSSAARIVTRRDRRRGRRRTKSDRHGSDPPR